MVDGITLATVFDRETGQVISGWNRFTIPEAEVRAWVAEQAAGDDRALRREMEAALEPEWLSVEFPRGGASQSGGRLRVVRGVRKTPGAVLQPWAIPDSPEDAG